MLPEAGSEAAGVVVVVVGGFPALVRGRAPEEFEVGGGGGGCSGFGASLEGLEAVENRFWRSAGDRILDLRCGVL